MHESEIWADGDVAMSAFRRTGYQSLTATLADPSDAGLAALKAYVARDPRLSINVLREPEYYAKQAGILSNLIRVLGYTVAVFMALGAAFGALNCMYSAIASRQVEIATLRAIGFGGFPVVVSVMIEALLLALLGGAVGGALAYLYCDGASLSTLNFSTFSQVAFAFRVTPGAPRPGAPVGARHRRRRRALPRHPRGPHPRDHGAARAVAASRRRVGVLRPVRLPEGVVGRLYLAAMPGRHEPLERTWEDLRREGIQVVVCLAEPEEIRAQVSRLCRRARGARRPVRGRVVSRRRLRCARRSRGVLGARLPRGEAADGGRAGGDPLRGGDRADGDARGVRAPRPGRAARAGRAGGIGRRVPSGDRRAARARVVVRGRARPRR